MVEHEEDLGKIPGIGQDLAGKVREIVKTGTLPLLEGLKQELSPELSALMEISGLGPKRVKTLYDEMGIRSIDELKRAAEEGKVRALAGSGAKTESTILEEIGKIKETKKGGRRIKLAVVEQVVEPLVGYLRKITGVKEIDVAGSYRRRRETVGDLDILVACGQGCPVMDRFVDYEDVEKVLSRGKTRSSVLFRNGLQVDLRVVPEASYRAALLYFTGSKAHNIVVRKIAQKRKFKINGTDLLPGGLRCSPSGGADFSGIGGEDHGVAALGLLGPQQGQSLHQGRSRAGGKIHDPTAAFPGASLSRRKRARSATGTGKREESWSRWITWSSSPGQRPTFPTRVRS